MLDCRLVDVEKIDCFRLLIFFLKMISVRFSDHYFSLPSHILLKQNLKIEMIEGIILK